MVGFVPGFLFIKLLEITVNGAPCLTNRNLKQKNKIPAALCIFVFTIFVLYPVKLIFFSSSL